MRKVLLKVLDELSVLKNTNLLPRSSRSEMSQEKRECGAETMASKLLYCISA